MQVHIDVIQRASKKRSRNKRQQRMKMTVPGKLFPVKHFCHRDHRDHREKIFFPRCPLCPLWLNKIFPGFAAGKIFDKSVDCAHSSFLLVNRVPGPKPCSPGFFAFLSFFPVLVSDSPAFTSCSWILWFSSSSLFRTSFRACGEIV